jgi:hypothetical protein
MSDPSSAAVVLHVDLGYPHPLSRSSLDGPLRPYPYPAPPLLLASLSISSPAPVTFYVFNEGARDFMPDFESAVNGVFVRDVPLAVEAWDTSFGTILSRLETMRLAWPTSSLSVLIAVPKALLLCPSLVSCSLLVVERGALQNVVLYLTPHLQCL